MIQHLILPSTTPSRTDLPNVLIKARARVLVTKNPCLVARVTPNMGLAVEKRVEGGQSKILEKARTTSVEGEEGAAHQGVDAAGAEDAVEAVDAVVVAVVRSGWAKAGARVQGHKRVTTYSFIDFAPVQRKIHVETWSFFVTFCTCQIREDFVSRTRYL